MRTLPLKTRLSNSQMVVNVIKGIILVFKEKTIFQVERSDSYFIKWERYDVRNENQYKQNHQHEHAYRNISKFMNFCL